MENRSAWQPLRFNPSAHRESQEGKGDSQQTSGCKRGRDSMDCGDTSDSSYGPADIAVCLGKRLLPDAMLQKVVVPQLKAAQRTQGFVRLHTLASCLASVLSDGDSTEVSCLLSLSAVEDFLLAPGLHYECLEKAAILCAALAVDPWNSVNAAAACQVGNLGQQPLSLHEAVAFHRSKRWDMAHAWNMASLPVDPINTLMNFSPAAPRPQWKRARRSFA